MRSGLDPLQFVVIAIAGWMNQHQQQVVEYLFEENRVLREQIGGRRMRFNDDQRRRLAVKAKTLGRKLLARVATIVTPETLLAWHRKLIAEKYDGSASERAKLPTAGLHCKSWEEFAKPGAPHLDFVFTVCDGAPGEVCPVWPGQPITGHWDVPDPTSVSGSQEEIDRAFLDVFTILERRISLFLCLPFSSLDQLAIKNAIAQK